jgi:hypothetical protein
MLFLFRGDPISIAPSPQSNLTIPTVRTPPNFGPHNRHHGPRYRSRDGDTDAPAGGCAAVARAAADAVEGGVRDGVSAACEADYRPSLGRETHPVTRQNTGTLDSGGSKSINTSKFCVLSGIIMLCGPPEHS